MSSPPTTAGRVPHPGLCFGAGLLVTLLLGAGLGALNLFKADWSAGTVTGESVLVHAHAQIFGFVVLFVVGIVGHALPRITGRPLAWPGLLWLAFGAATAAQLAFPFGVWLHQAPVVRLGEALDVSAALALTVAVAAATSTGAAAIRPWLRLGSLGLLAASLWGFAGALDGRLLLMRPALWQLALWGFIAPFIFGMSTHVLDMAGGFDVRLGGEGLLAALWAIAVALVTLSRAGALPELAASIGQLLQLAVALAASYRLGLFRRRKRPSAGAPFFASAYVWLLLSLTAWAAIGLGLLPDHLLIDDVARHTFTIGCVTQMIVGVALRALAVAGGVRLAWPALATAAYLLLNGAVVLRLARILAATVAPGALWFSGVSGFLALACLLGFGASLFGTARRVLAARA
ncbi:MAG: NnrS family protein [Myxococcales bacterium]